MMGKNHIVTNAASAVIIYTGLNTLSKLEGNTIADVTSTCADIVIQSMSTCYDWSKPIVISCGIVCFFIGTLFPDIDSNTSLLGRFLHLPIGHRSWTHAIWIPLIFFVAGFVFTPLWWYTAGYVLHLFWDALSKGGVCWFYPISKYRKYNNGAQVKRHHPIKLYTVNSTSEYIVVAIVVFMACCCGLILMGVKLPMPLIV